MYSFITHPYLKKEDKSQPSNYRPVALLSCIGKLQERIVFKNMYNFLLDNNLLYEGCSNMNASRFITFFTYMLRQNGKRFYKGQYVTFKLAPNLKKNTAFLSSYSPLNEGHVSILKTQCFEHILVI